MKECDILARIVKLICLCLMVLYICGRMPIPLIVIPLIGCTVIHVSNEVKEIKDEKKNNRKRNKKVTKKKS